MRRLSVMLLAIFFFFYNQSTLASSMVQSMTNQQLIRAGREAYVNRCSGCHGMEADGKGAAAQMLNPRPRNLREGAFKFRSTPYGVLPTVDDLLRTIDQGIPGSSMPSFKLVSRQEKLAIVAYIRSLRTQFRDTLSSQVSIPIPPPKENLFHKKEVFLEGARRGKVVYQEQQCAMCHGDQGKGDGPSANQLMDTENRKILPANLTHRTIKSGPTARDLFKAIATGIEGSPMPAYYEMLTDAQRWDLVAYIMFLRGKAHGMYEGEEIQ